MKSKYVYKNGIVTVVRSGEFDEERFQKVTEEFLRKVIEQENQNGNKHKTGDIKEKPILDK